MAWITGEQHGSHRVRPSTSGVPAGNRRRRGSRSTVLGTALAGALALGACSAEPELTSATSLALPTTSATPTASPSPTSTLTPEEQEAFDQATQAALAYRQVIVDLYSGVRTRVNDLNDVATDPQLSQELPAIFREINEGVRTEPRGYQLTLVSAHLKRMDLTADKPTVSVRLCIDASGATATLADGTRVPGVRQWATYRVTKTDYLPSPGWAVAGFKRPEDPQDRPC